jgi:hypothetical protein
MGSEEFVALVRGYPGLFPEELGEQVDLLFEQFVIVTEVVPEQREGLGARSASEDNFGAAAGHRVQG